MTGGGPGARGAGCRPIFQFSRIAPPPSVGSPAVTGEGKRSVNEWPPLAHDPPPPSRRGARGRFELKIAPIGWTQRSERAPPHSHDDHGPRRCLERAAAAALVGASRPARRRRAAVRRAFALAGHTAARRSARPYGPL